MLFVILSYTYFFLPSQKISSQKWSRNADDDCALCLGLGILDYGCAGTINQDLDQRAHFLFQIHPYRLKSMSLHILLPVCVTLPDTACVFSLNCQGSLFRKNDQTAGLTNRVLEDVRLGARASMRMTHGILSSLSLLWEALLGMPYFSFLGQEATTTKKPCQWCFLILLLLNMSQVSEPRNGKYNVTDISYFELLEILWIVFPPTYAFLQLWVFLWPNVLAVPTW